MNAPFDVPEDYRTELVTVFDCGGHVVWSSPAWREKIPDLDVRWQDYADPEEGPRFLAWLRGDLTDTITRGVCTKLGDHCSGWFELKMVGHKFGDQIHTLAQVVGLPCGHQLYVECSCCGARTLRSGSACVKCGHHLRRRHSGHFNQAVFLASGRGSSGIAAQSANDLGAALVAFMVGALILLGLALWPRVSEQMRERPDPSDEQVMTLSQRARW